MEDGTYPSEENQDNMSMNSINMQKSVIENSQDNKTIENKSNKSDESDKNSEKSKRSLNNISA